MKCPYCNTSKTRQLNSQTALGYQRYECTGCSKRFNERTGTAFNYLELPTDIVFQVIFCRYRYRLSYRELSEIFGMRGFEISHETVRAWEERFSSHFADELRAKRKGTVGRVLYIDETYMKLRGKHCYLYRGMDEKVT